MATAIDSDAVLRPRPRKPVHSQVSQLTATAVASSSSVSGSLLDIPIDSGIATGTTSGRSTPIPPDAPPSVKVLSSARKQARAEQRRRIFPTIEYASRLSHFDPNSDYRDFHGFFNLFWIGLAIMAITTMLRNIKDTGYPLRVEIWSLFTVKLWHLGLADFFMVASTGPSLLLQQALRSRRLSWGRTGIVLQSLYQVVWLVVWIDLPFALDWTWTAQVFLLLHTMVFLMKMHSYAFYNGHLSDTERRLRALDHPDTASKAPAYLYPTLESPGGALASPKHGDSGAVSTEENAGGEDAKKEEKEEQEEKGEKEEGKEKETGQRQRQQQNNNGPATPAGYPASHDPDNDPDSDYDVARLRELLARELTSPMGNITFPRNLTWANYVDYVFCPTLCYELEYPRTAAIDWQSLVSKIIAVFGCIFLLTVTSEEFILPVLVESSLRLDAGPPLSEKLLILAEAISWLLFPFMLTFLLVFLVIFEYVLGALAEITRFADRHFYSDWWNSTDWMEFSREWNIPVYSFLRRHVYSASRPHIGRNFATVITFLISAIGHEIVLGCITKKLRGYGFICQMLQLPIVALQRTRLVRGKKTLNNVCFWCSMIMGLSLICSLYVLV